MPRTIQTVGGHAALSASAFTLFTPNSGDSFDVQNFANNSKATLWQMWGRLGSAGQIRLRSPRMHDQVQGIRIDIGASIIKGLLPWAPQPLYASDTLTFDTQGSGATPGNASGFLMIEYDDLPGSAPRLETWNGVVSRIVNLAGVEVTIPASGTAGDWSVGTAINADFDNLKSNTDYAILGLEGQAAYGAIAVAGPDTSNYKIGVPLSGDPLIDGMAFVATANYMNGAAIPIINSNNKGTTLLYGADEGNAGVTISLILAQLG